MFSKYSSRTKRRKVAAIVDNLIEEVRKNEEIPLVVKDVGSELDLDLSSEEDARSLEMSDTDTAEVIPYYEHRDNFPLPPLRSLLASWSVRHNITQSALKDLIPIVN